MLRAFPDPSIFLLSISLFYCKNFHISFLRQFEKDENLTRLNVIKFITSNWYRIAEIIKILINHPSEIIKKGWPLLDYSTNQSCGLLFRESPLKKSFFRIKDLELEIFEWEKLYKLVLLQQQKTHLNAKVPQISI